MARLVDTTLRLLAQEPIAGRVPASLQFEACEMLDSAGFHVLEVTGGGCFYSAINRGVESPWERIRNLKKRATQTPLGMALRGRFLVGTQPVEQDLIRRFVDSAAESGIAVFRMHDPMNDPEDLIGPVEAVRETGARLHLGLVYDDHPDGAQRLIDRAPALAQLGADRLLLLDPAGALDPSRTGTLITALRDAAGVPVGLYPQGPGGTSLAVAIEAARAGADPISVAAYPLAVSGHRTSSELLCQAVDGLGLESGINQGILWEVAELLDRALFADTTLPPPLSAHVSLLAAIKGVPAGLVSGVERRLAAIDASDRLADVLDEVQRVREDLGSPPAASPLGDVFVRQAIDHVLEGRRWHSIDGEMRALIRGEWGRPPAPVNPEVVALAEAGNGGASATPVPVDLAGARAEAGELATSEEELCLVALFGEDTLPLLERLRGRHNAITPGTTNEEDDRIRSLVEVLEETGLGELTVEENGTRITLRQQTAVQQVVAEPIAAAAPEAAAAPTGTQITSPMVGTFYRCAAPGEPTFVDVGTTVAVGQVLCILEAMKLFNEFKAETTGTITKILVEDAATVEYGQPLFEIDPSGA
ncbi:MAG: acetyl-CoA carboxylase, biotin carboxyl carrier protein [Thermoleophilia bacterium]|nr:MAG: acetyl-CoA carboxylase, biotin carboxyl carrier protein [Thermoleophilia bacterium]